MRTAWRVGALLEGWRLTVGYLVGVSNITIISIYLTMWYWVPTADARRHLPRSERFYGPGERQCRLGVCVEHTA